MSEQDSNPKWSTTKKWILTSFYEWWRKFPLTTKGGATRPLESWKIETSFLLDKQWQSTTYHSWHDYIQLSNKEGFGHAMRHTWSFKVLMFLNKHWTVYVSVCKSVFFVVSLLEASPVHEHPMGPKRGSPKVWKSDIVYGYPTNDKRTFHFQY